ncbi:glycerate kinase [Salmonella enterica subsp. enterica]|nr:glycerate kinase [Salmonella enterica subsp. enterica]
MLINAVRLLKRDFQPYFLDARCLFTGSPMAEKETVDAMVAATGGKRVSWTLAADGGKSKRILWPDRRRQTAIIEMAAASGLMLVAPRGA